MTKVDLALYLPNNMNDVYSCVEFKQFPIAPRYFGPNGRFNPEDLFKDYEEEEKSDSKEWKSLALHKFLRQMWNVEP